MWELFIQAEQRKREQSFVYPAHHAPSSSVLAPVFSVTGIANGVACVQSKECKAQRPERTEDGVDTEVEPYVYAAKALEH